MEEIIYWIKLIAGTITAISTIYIFCKKLIVKAVTKRIRADK
jgi:hypothetical protein